MACCKGKRKKEAENPIVDIERCIVEYAWENQAHSTKLDRLLRSRRYDLELNYGFLNIQNTMKDYKVTPIAHTNGLQSNVIKRELTLFKTQFTNTTGIDQKFTFKTQRTTTSTAEVKITKGYQLNGKLDVSFKVPLDVCKVTGALGGQLSVTKVKGEKFEEVLTWGVDTEVVVEHGKRCTATLVVREEETRAEFLMKSVISCTEDIIPVYVVDKKTRATLQVLHISSNNLHRVLKNFTRVDGKEDQVMCETKGTYKVVYGAEQQIDVRYEDLVPGVAGPTPPCDGGKGTAVVSEATGCNAAVECPAPHTELIDPTIPLTAAADTPTTHTAAVEVTEEEEDSVTKPLVIKVKAN